MQTLDSFSAFSEQPQNKIAISIFEPLYTTTIDKR